MIIANITSFEGLCADAEHYYCEYLEVPNDYVLRTQEYIHSDIELKYDITSQEYCDNLNIKDSWSGWHIGMDTVRFESINDIHEKLISLFPNETIVTYYENKIFKGMLYLKDRVNLGYLAFGEVWSPIYNSVYKDLLPESLIIKCEECGKEYKVEDISKEIDYDGRTIIEFHKRWNMNKCCNEMSLIWNAII